MSLSTHLQRQSSGLYYLRVVVPRDLRSRLGLTEIRRSLGTRERVTARSLSFRIAAALVDYFELARRTGMADRAILDELIRRGLLPADGSIPAQFELEYTPGGRFFVRSDPNCPEDGAQALKAVEAFAAVVAADQARAAAVAAPAAATPARTESRSPTVGPVIAKYLDRGRTKWRDKTYLEYKAILERFADFVGRRPLRSLQSADIAAYIEAQIKAGLGAKAADKHLSPLGGLFEYAASVGDYPRSLSLPTKGLCLLKKSDKKRLAGRSGWQPFLTADLQTLFKPEH